MYALTELISLLIQLIELAIYLYIISIFLYSFVSYFPNLRESRLNYYLSKICDPLLNAFRFATIGSISFAPMIATFFLLILLEVLHWLY